MIFLKSINKNCFLYNKKQYKLSSFYNKKIQNYIKLIQIKNNNIKNYNKNIFLL